MWRQRIVGCVYTWGPTASPIPISRKASPLLGIVSFTCEKASGKALGSFRDGSCRMTYRVRNERRRRVYTAAPLAYCWHQAGGRRRGGYSPTVAITRHIGWCPSPLLLSEPVTGATEASETAQITRYTDCLGLKEGGRLSRTPATPF